MEMIPSAHLRRVDRLGREILQQGWFPKHGGHMEWRDIPWEGFIDHKTGELKSSNKSETDNG